MAEVRHAIDPVSGKKVEIRNDLVRRLRGEYATGPTMPNGEPEFGWRKFGEPSPINLEAADEIDRLRNHIEKLLGQLHGRPVKHPQQTAEREAARAAIS